MYNLKYRNIDLSVFGDIMEFEKNILPEREYTSINLETINGEILQTNKYKKLEIKITIFVEKNTEKDLKLAMKEIANLFNTKTPEKLYINDEVFYNCITINGIELEKLHTFMRLVKINLVAFDPCAYSVEEKTFNTIGKRLEIINEGTEIIKPIISFGFTEDTHFVQAKHNNEIILLGDYPKLDLPSTEKTSTVIYEDMHDANNWVDSIPLLDSNRDANGLLTINTSQKQMILGNLPSSSSSKWKGGCKRLNINTELKEFQVRAWFMFGSPGENNDPNIDNLPGLKDGTMKYEGVRYVSKQTVDYRDKPDTTEGKVIGKLVKGFVLENGNFELVGEWLKFPANAMKGHEDSDEYYYTSNQGGLYWTKEIYIKTITSTSRNYKVTGNKGQSSENGTINIRSGPSTKYDIVGTIKVGEGIRCWEKDIYDTENAKNSDGTRKIWKLMSNSCDGIKGYINSIYITKSEDVGTWIDTSELEGYADDKTGVLELYGYDVSGSIIFKLSIEDSSKYFEYNQPSIRIGGKEIYKYDNGAKDPDIIKVTLDSGVKEYRLLQGETGDWNMFGGNFIIERKKNSAGKYTWKFIIQNVGNGKQLTKTNIVNTDTDEKNLSYIAVYMGTNGIMEKACDMRLDTVEIKNLEENSDEDNPTNNIYFKKGDVLDIHQNGDVYLNGINKNELIDIGSDIFKLTPGENTITIMSDDENISTTAIITEKWAGGEW